MLLNEINKQKEYASLNRIHMGNSSILKYMNFYFTALLIGCNQQSQTENSNKPKSKLHTSLKPYKGLHGTWIRYDKFGFTLIEIKDSTNATYYQFSDLKKYADTITQHRFFYYKSKARVGYWKKDSSNIWVKTDRFRFDFIKHGDNLTEYDKMGDQGTFVKAPEDPSR